jgi:hypothetical protein
MKEDAIMKIFALAIAATLAASTAYAQDTTVIHKDGMLGSKKTVIKHDSDADVAVRRKVEVHTGSLSDCKTKTVKKTNDMGDTVKKTKSSC